MVEEGEKTGIVDLAERELIESVIVFNDRTVVEAMTTRPDIVALPMSSTLPTLRDTIDGSGHSRIPIYDDSLDHIIGVVHARDLVQFVASPDAPFDIRDVMRQPFFVPESKPLPDLLRDFRHQNVHLAIALDEYGGTAGLISIEDVLEELVGEMSREGADETAMFKRIDDTTAEVDARMHIEEFNRFLGTALPEDAGYDTLGGFVSAHLGRIPPEGHHLRRPRRNIRNPRRPAAPRQPRPHPSRAQRGIVFRWESSSGRAHVALENCIASSKITRLSSESIAGLIP